MFVETERALSAVVRWQSPDRNRPLEGLVMAEPNPTRKPLARAEKYRPRTVKMTDSLWARFTESALAEGQANISTFVRDCAVIGMEYRERDRVFGTHRGMTGNPAAPAGNTVRRTAG